MHNNWYGCFRLTLSGTPIRQIRYALAMLDDIKKTLWTSADKLRANMDAAEYKHLVLG